MSLFDNFNKKTKYNITRNFMCPICGQYVFKYEDDNDICRVCFWENDGLQYDNPNLKGGANNLSLNNYKKWWEKLNTIIPNLMKKYEIKPSKLSLWTYDEMIVPRENMKNFVNELTNNNIKIRLSFYHLCKKYSYDYRQFAGFPYVNCKTAKQSNNKCLDIIFTENPIQVCEKYNLKQVLEILNKSKNINETWEKLTPYISIMPNPTMV